MPPAVNTPDFGTDIDAVTDLDAHMNTVSGLTNLVHAIARRLSVDRGTLPYDTDYGYDLRRCLGESFTQTTLLDIARATEAECEKDDRIIRAHVDVSGDPIAQAMLVTIQLETALGPFRLVLAVTAVTVAIVTYT